MSDFLESELKNCEYCGKQFKPHREDQKFCSNECLHFAAGELEVFRYRKKKPTKRKTIKTNRLKVNRTVD